MRSPVLPIPTHMLWRIARSTLAVKILVAAAVIAAVGDNSASQPISDVAGSWRGVYLAYPNVTLIDLELTSAGGSDVQGTATFRPLESDQRNALRGSSGSYRVTGTFQPGTGSFTLTPGEWLERPSQLTRPLGMTGVVERRSRVIAGTFDGVRGGNPYFVLTSPTKANAELLEPVRDAENRTPGRAPGISVGGRRIPLSGGVDKEKIARWASRFRSEYPETDLRRTVMGELHARARNLFEDGHFRQHFGETFDKMSDSDREKIGRVLRDPNRGQELEPYGFLQSAFMGTGQFNPQDITISVLAQRAIRAWRDDALGRLRAAQASPGTLSELGSYNQTVDEVVNGLWPSEMQAFRSEITSTSARLATPLLNQWADGIINRASGHEGLAEIGAAISQVSGTSDPSTPVRTSPRRSSPAPATTPADRNSPEALARAVSDEARSAVVTKLRAKADSLLPPLVAKEREQIQSFGTGGAALQSGTRWHSNFMSRFASFTSSAAVRDALAEFQARRQRDLATAEGELIQRIQSSATETQISALLATNLGVATDRTDPAGSRIFAVAASRQRVVAEATAQAEVAARSAVNFCKGLSTDDRVEPAEPSSNEMCLALAGKFDAINDNLKSQEQACKGGGFKNNPVLALQCLQLCGASGGSCNLSVSLTRFEKIACEKATGEPGYVCDYIMRMSASSPAAQQALATIAPGGSTDQARFLKTAKGWIQLASRRRHPANFSVEVQRDTDESAQQLPACAQ